MKLYKQTTRYHEGMDFDAFETASLQDIRQAAKEFKCVVLSLTDIRDFIREYEDAFDDAARYRPDWVKHVIAAAEAAE